jgi:cell division protein FtsW (lipid II flippase)
MLSDTQGKTAPWPRLQDALPLLVMWLIAMAIVIAQRDLGTGMLLFGVFVTLVYLATGRARNLVLGGILAVVGGAVAYAAFGVVRARLSAWLDPWSDPSGGAFQIIQALIALASGDVLGRGLGLGNPALVPLAHSDFILTSIAEEFGLFGVVGVLALHALLAARGLRIAWQADRAFDQLLAAGLSALTAFQTLLIAGGTVRALPLTGVTLPFVSYGGSSLLVQFIAIGLLLAVSAHPRSGDAARRSGDARRRMAAAAGVDAERSNGAGA